MYMHKISDKELIRQFLDGKDSSFETLFNRHKNKVYTNIYIMVKDEQLAEDIFQDTFIKAISTLKNGRYNEEGKFVSWIMRIAHNMAIDHFRRNAKMPTIGQSCGENDFDIFSTIKSNEPTIESGLIQNQISDDVKALVHLLPDEQKEVIKMRLYFDMSFKEISVSTGVSINTALGRMRYALINLRKMIEDKKLIMTE